MEAKEFLSYIIGLSGVIISVITWMRFRRKDLSVAGKTDAEAEKIKAEAAETRALTEIKLTDAALGLARRLSEELDITKKEFAKIQEELSNTLHTLRTLENALQAEKLRCKDLSEEIENLQADLQKLKNG